jgi:hypothetical protein
VRIAALPTPRRTAASVPQTADRPRIRIRCGRARRTRYSFHGNIHSCDAVLVGSDGSQRG